MIKQISRSGYVHDVFVGGRPPCSLGSADVDDLWARIQSLDEHQMRAALHLLAVKCQGRYPDMDAEMLGGAIAYGAGG